MGLSQDISKLSLISKLILVEPLNKMVKPLKLFFSHKSAGDLK